MVRYLLDLWIIESELGKFPLATFVVNVLGCFLIGVFYALSERFDYSLKLKLLLTVGFCGGFTTFSSFSYESFLLLKNGSYALFLGYIFVSILSGTSAVFFGAWLFKK